RSREVISSLGWYCLPFQTNWLVSVCSWVIMLCGAGDTDAWYQKSERMKVLRTSTLPLSDRLREESELALALAFWRRECQSVVVFSGVIGSITPRVLSGRGAG